MTEMKRMVILDKIGTLRSPEGPVHRVGVSLNGGYRKVQTQGPANSIGTFPRPA